MSDDADAAAIQDVLRLLELIENAARQELQLIGCPPNRWSEKAQELLAVRYLEVPKKDNRTSKKIVTASNLYNSLSYVKDARDFVNTGKYALAMRSSLFAFKWLIYREVEISTKQRASGRQSRPLSKLNIKIMALDDAKRRENPRLSGQGRARFISKSLEKEGIYLTPDAVRRAIQRSKKKLGHQASPPQIEPL